MSSLSRAYESGKLLCQENWDIAGCTTDDAAWECLSLPPGQWVNHGKPVDKVPEFVTVVTFEARIFEVYQAPAVVLQSRPRAAIRRQTHLDGIGKLGGSLWKIQIVAVDPNSNGMCSLPY